MIQQDLAIPDHLEELRTRIIVCLVTISVFSVIAFIFSDVLIAVITHPIRKSIESLYFLRPYEAFMTKIKVSLVAGLIASLPVIFMQLWFFVAPGLYQKEKRTSAVIIAVSVALFVIGVLFAYFVAVPFALQFFLGFGTETLRPMISIGSYIGFFLNMTIVFGIVFDFPVVNVGLIYAGVLKTSWMRRYRRIVIVLAFTAAAVLTPTVDIFTQLCLALPLWFLFELSIGLGLFIERTKKGGVKRKENA